MIDATKLFAYTDSTILILPIHDPACNGSENSSVAIIIQEQVNTDWKRRKAWLATKPIHIELTGKRIHHEL